ncbi:hypothetical protein NLI96_g1021 [Meripilus lineatus]|uniref:Uncharacterized protein n=1 Tax=Meripilus lineatus TaxID=2056292 RepID=A0AAD5VB94_9APHY|nr:hypothetical protein NLI96_g1021 [Physisporinus lineatus]
MASISSIITAKDCGFRQKLMLMFSRESKLVDQAEGCLQRVIIVLQGNEDKMCTEQLEETKMILEQYHQLNVDGEDLQAWLAVLKTKDKKDPDYSKLKKDVWDLTTTFYIKSSSLKKQAMRTSARASASGIGRRLGINKGIVLEVMHGEFESLPPYPSDIMVKEIERLRSEGFTLDDADLSIFRDGKDFEEEKDSLTEDEQWAILSSIRVVCNNS